MNKVTVFHYRRDLDETRTCSLGCSHDVTFHERKTLTLAPEEFWDETVKGLHYTRDGVGTIQVAYDAQGRRYTKTPHWDGPHASGWKRTDGKVFFLRPVLKKDAAFTLDNRPITL